jgi:hypothetical protein
MDRSPRRVTTNPPPHRNPEHGRYNLHQLHHRLAMPTASSTCRAAVLISSQKPMPKPRQRAARQQDALSELVGQLVSTEATGARANSRSLPPPPLSRPPSGVRSCPCRPLQQRLHLLRRVLGQGQRHRSAAGPPGGARRGRRAPAQPGRHGGGAGEPLWLPHCRAPAAWWPWSSQAEAAPTARPPAPRAAGAAGQRPRGRGQGGAGRAGLPLWQWRQQQLGRAGAGRPRGSCPAQHGRQRRRPGGRIAGAGWVEPARLCAPLAARPLHRRPPPLCCPVAACVAATRCAAAAGVRHGAVALLAGLLSRRGAAAYRLLLPLPAATPAELQRIGSAALQHDSVVLRKEAAAYLLALALCAATGSSAAGPRAAAAGAAGDDGALGTLPGQLLQLCAGDSVRQWEAACELLCACCAEPRVGEARVCAGVRVCGWHRARPAVQRPPCCRVRCELAAGAARRLARRVAGCAPLRRCAAAPPPGTPRRARLPPAACRLPPAAGPGRGARRGGALSGPAPARLAAASGAAGGGGHRGGARPAIPMDSP